ncbi:MAG: class I SAM-dependent methyltransferase [candidate division Zixibacteria bacterium]|nr:class I SAM-dependent methyltransferase [candidate division Zixibacteria bacterium]MDH3935956.1 class I SAM-dependent methyltransferase [candidate division Zixibacteria bacterium]MDH4035656.1 class I SAM-dependent methyltransferase [candidate division Zixibacteria bacterium]
MPEPRNPYENPDLYELAFSWRDYAKATDFISEAARLAGCAEIKSMVELGCGPGQYCREFGRRGVTAYGVDLSPEMALYAQRTYDEEKLPGHILEADMRDFRLEQRVDLACCMMATFSHLLTNRDIVEHLDAVADNLREGGLYVLELPHPRDAFDTGKSTQDVWEMEEEGAKLSIDWCSDGVFDPLTETDLGTVKFSLEQDGLVKNYESPSESRRLVFGTLRALLDLSGRFHIAAMYGDLDVNIPFDNAKAAWRLVLVLRKSP